MKRRVEAESWEKEAREKDLSLAEVSEQLCVGGQGTINTFFSNQVEERRIRGNRRRSRRSRGTDLTEQKYKVDNPSALLWTGIISDSTFVKSLAISHRKVSAQMWSRPCGEQ